MQSFIKKPSTPRILCDTPPFLCDIYKSATFPLFSLLSFAAVLSAVNISIKPALARRCALRLRPPGADNTGTPSPYLLRNDTLDSRRVKRGLVLLLSDPQTENKKLPAEL